MISFLLLDTAFIAVMLGCAACDRKSRTIPNAMIVVLLGMGLLRLLLLFLKKAELACQLMTIPLFVLCLLCWRKGQLGGGDVKLITAIFFYMGLWDAAAAFAVSLLPLIYLCIRNGIKNRQQIAMAPPLAFGCTAVIVGQYLAAVLLN